jgi:hypothetical protein
MGEFLSVIAAACVASVSTGASGATIKGTHIGCVTEAYLDEMT